MSRRLMKSNSLKYISGKVAVTALTLLIAGELTMPVVLAQTPAGRTGGAAAGTQQEQVKQQLLDDGLIKKPNAGDEVLDKQKEDDASNYSDEEVTYVYNVHLVGNEAVKTEKLEPLVKHLEGQNVSMRDIKSTVSKVKSYYRNKGFISVFVHTPPQDISKGELTIHIIEGKLGEIRFEGNDHYSDKMLRGQIEIQEGETLAYDNFVSDLVRLNKNQNIDAKATFQKGDEFGETDVVVNVEDRRRFHITGSFSNFVSNTVGGLRGGVGIDFDSPFGKMDHFSAYYQGGRDAFAVNADYNIPINKKGTRIGTSYSHSIIDVRGPLTALGLEGRARTHTGYLSHPLVEKEFFSLKAFSGLDWKNVENNVFNTTFGRENLRVIHGGLSMEKKWPKLGGVTYANSSVRFGLGGILGASETGDAMIRARTSNKFFVSSLGLDHYQNLGKGIIGRVKSQVQLSPDRLPTLEQSRLGGNYTVRGYQEGERLADTSMLVSGELYFPFFLLPKSWKLPKADKTLREQIQPFVFADYGYGRVTNPLVSEKRERNLLGVGGGLRVQLYRKLFGRVEWAAPLGSEATDNRGSAFYFNLNVEAL